MSLGLSRRGLLHIWWVLLLVRGGLLLDWLQWTGVTVFCTPLRLGFKQERTPPYDATHGFNDIVIDLYNPLILYYFFLSFSAFFLV